MSKTLKRFIIALVAAVMMFTSLSWDGFRIVAEESKTHDVFESTTSQMRVTVTAEKGTFPEGTKMKVKDIGQDQALAYAHDAMGEENVVNAYAVDITFYLDGEETQPSDPSKVQVSLKPLKEDISEKDIVVLHVENETEKVTPVNDAEVADRSNSVSFESQGFSVYVVVETGNDARLLVKFVKGETEMASMYVKKGDDMDKALYDPGVGELSAGVVFKGWTTNPDYTTETTGLTIDQVRTEVNGMLPPEADGTEVTYYAILIKQYIVTYLDETSSSLGQHIIEFRADSEETLRDYKVNMAYTPVDDTHDFEGWLVLSGSSNIQGYVADQAYENGTDIKISGDVVFAVNSPEGHWLVFNENGRGATYVAPKFIYSNDVTVEPSNNMVRKGYTFGGWYDSKAHADAHAADPSVTTGKFEFGHTITDKTTVYASWIPAQTADYTVIIWKQNLAGNGYDFERAISLSGNVGATINTVTQQGTGDAAYARINGTNYQYTGFHLKSFDTGVTIATEGNSVVNVYYDRTEYTLTFKDNRTATITYVYEGYTYSDATIGNAITNQNNINTLNGNNKKTISGYTVSYYGNNNRTYAILIDGTWYQITSEGRYVYNASAINGITGAIGGIVKTITALYGQDISSNFPIPGYEGYVWEPQNSSVYTGGDVPSIEQMREENTTFVAKRYGTSVTIHMYYYTEAIGNEPAGTTTVQYGGKTYVEHLHVTISASGGITSTEGEDFINIAGYDHNGSVPAYTNGRVELNNSNNYTIKFYYTRALYKILLMDGAYFDGNGNPITEPSQGKLGEIDNIAYGADTSSYNNFKPQNAPAGYVFEGWCSDTKCTQPYNFTTMPEGGVTVYAKWRQIQYRVFLHPNAGTDPTLDWGSETQAMNFRISYGGTVDTPTGIRKGYTFVGWYTDEACTQIFNEEAFVLNETTVTTPYDKTTHMTDNMDKWGNIDPNSPTPDGQTVPGYNSDVWGYDPDAENHWTRRERTWITKELNLYAKWRPTLDGADGIGVIYDKNGGTGNPQDTHTYVPGAMATAVAAIGAPANKQFAYWVMQQWDGEKYVDVAGSKINPGESYEINVDYAHKVPNGYKMDENNNYLDENGNITTDPSKYVQLYTYTIQLRAEFKDKEEPTPTHIYWYANNGTDAVVEDEPLDYNQAIDIRPATTFSYANHTFVGWAKSADATEPWLKWENGKWYYKNNNTWVETPYNKVAADEDQPYDNLYAIWSAEVTVKIIGSEASKVYNGQQQSNSTYTVEYYVGGEKVDALPDGVTLTITSEDADNAAKGTNVGEYSIQLSGSLNSTNPLYTIPENAVSYDETYQGKVKLEITKRPVTVTVVGNKDTKEYNGEEQEVTGYTITISDPLYKDNYMMMPMQEAARAAGTDVGTYPMGLANEFANSNNNFDVTFNITDGSLTITKATIHVQIVGNTDSKVYNGNEQECPNYTVVIPAGVTITENELLHRNENDNGTFIDLPVSEDKNSGRWSAKGTHKGTYPMGLAASQFSTRNKNYDVIFDVTDGSLEITPLAVVITIEAPTQEKMYNGKYQWAQFNDGETLHYTVSSDLFPLSDIDITDIYARAVTVAGGVDAGEYTTTLSKGGWTPFIHVGADISDFTVTFEVVEGKLTITKAPLTIKVIDQIYPYDAQPHGENNATYTTPEEIADKVTVEGLQGEDVDEYMKKDILSSITLNGQETAAGVYELKIEASDAEVLYGHVNPDHPNHAITDNYDVTYVAGKLTITNAELVVKVTGKTDSVEYDGTEQSVDGYTLECDSNLFDASKVSYNLRPTAKGTNVGTYDMGLDASQFRYNDSNITVVFQIVKDGELVITPKPITVTITGKKDSKVYNGEEQKVEGYTVSISDSLYTEADFTFDGEAVAKGTNVGTYPMGLTEDDFGNQNDNFVVTFVVTDGELEITPKEIEVRIIGNNGTFTYDGQPHTVEGYTVECDDEMYDTSNAVLINVVSHKEYNPKASRTDVGTTYMGIRLSLTIDGSYISCTPKNNDPNFKVTFKVTDGYVQITPREYTITVEDKTVPYNGKEQEGNTAYTFGNLAEGHTATVTYTPAKGTDVGTYDNGLFADDVVILDADGNDVTANYVAGTKTPGKLNIEVLDVTVTITGHKGEFDYNGEPHTVSGYDVSWTAKAWDLDCLEFTGTDSVTETAAGTYPMGLAENQFSNTNPNCNVTFVVEDGELKINKVSINITITGHTGTFPFDNTPHTVEGYDATSTSELFDASLVACTSDATITETNAGRYDMGLAVSQFSYNDPSIEATFTVNDGWMVISTASVVVTIKGHHDTTTYDGTEHSVSGYDVEISDPLYKETDFTFTGTAAAARTDVGTTNMGLTADMFANNNPNFEDVEFIIVDGYQTIEKLAVKVTITGNKDSKVYNGEEQKVEGYEVSISNPLYKETDLTFSGTDVAKGTNVGKYPMGLAENQFTNNNGNFDVTFEVTDGELEITKLAVTVTITGNKDSKVYNGEEQKVEGYEVSISNPLYKETDFTFSGTDVAKGTNVGKYPMGLAEDKFTNNNDNFEVTFSVTDGELEITPLAVTVVIIGEIREKVYNGEEQKVEGFRIDIRNDLYKKQYIDFTGEAVAKGTNVGEYPMGLTKEQFSNNNPNFTVSFEIKPDGKLIITPLEVTVTITGNKDSKVYNGEEQKVEGYTVSISDPLYTEDDFLCDKKAIAKGTNVGTYPMGLTEDDFGNQNDNFVVTFVVTDGELEITPKEIEVRIIGNNGTFTYDGKEHTVEGYTVECDDKLYDTSNAVLINVVSHKEYNPKASRTDVGTTYMGIRLSLTIDGSYISCTPKNNDPNFKVTFKVTDGYVEIEPKEVTITAKDAEKVYDGTPLTQPEFTVSDLAEGDTHEFTVEMTADSTITNAGTQPNVIATVDGVEVVAGEATAVGNYLVTIVDGTLTVTKLPITLRSASDSKEYDGTPLTNDEVTIIGELPKGVTITFDVTGSQTLPGTSDNTFTYTISKQRNFLMSLMRMFKAPAKAPSEEDNYDITVEYGTLEVKDRSEKYELEFTANSDEVTYDGKEHTVEGFTEELTYTNDKGVKYTIEGISASGKGTDAGEYVVAVTGDFKVLDAEGNDVTAQFTLKTNDGKLVINPKEVTVTAKDYTKNVDTEDPTFEADVEGLIGDDKVEYSIKREEGEEVGEYALTPEGEEEQGNYTVKFVAGTLTIVDNVPDTGDRTGLDFWYVTMSLSIIAFLAILVDMKKRRMFA